MIKFLCSLFFSFVLSANIYALDCAIEITFTDDLTGIEYVDSYHRLTDIKFNLETEEVIHVFRVWANKEAYASGLSPLTVRDSNSIKMYMPGEKFDEFFPSEFMTLLKKGSLDYIKTQDVDDEDSDTGVFVDYKNDGVKVE